MTEALSAQLKYSSLWAAIFLITNVPIAIAFHLSSSYIVEYVLAGLLILFVGIPIIELTKGLLLYLIGKGFRLKWSYMTAARTTLYASFPMTISYPLLAVIFIGMLISPVAFSAGFIQNLFGQLVRLSGFTIFLVPLTVIPVLLKLVVCIRTLARTQKIDIGRAIMISTSALVLVILVFAIPYTYLTALMA